MILGEAIRAAADRLAETSDTARLDAELLMAHALGVPRSDMLLRHTQDEVPMAFRELVDRRARHEPVAYITGWTEFYGRRFEVAPGVLIPRGDSETIIDAALEACPDPRRVLDMGTGSGALLVTVLAERPAAGGVGIDASPIAIEIAGSNAAALDLAADWAFHLRDWHETGWADDLGTFDLILCNPPYIEEEASLDSDVRDYEPASALFAGTDGLDDYRAIIPQLGKLLSPGGVAVLEIGHLQAPQVSQIARESGFAVAVKKDLGGRDRGLVLT